MVISKVHWQQYSRKQFIHRCLDINTGLEFEIGLAGSIAILLPLCKVSISVIRKNHWKNCLPLKEIIQVVATPAT